MKTRVMKFIAILSIGAALGALAAPAQAGTKWTARPKQMASMPQKWGPWQFCAVAGHAGYETRIRITGTPSGRWAPDQLQVRRVLGTTKTPPYYNLIGVDWYDSSEWKDGVDYPVHRTTRSTTLDIDPSWYTSAKRPAAKVWLGHGVSTVLCSPVFPASIL